LDFIGSTSLDPRLTGYAVRFAVARMTVLFSNCLEPDAGRSTPE
jgi:hypothetical protein